MIPALLIALALAAAVGGALLIARARRRLPARVRVSCPPQRYDSRPADGSFDFATLERLADVHPTSAEWADQPRAWRAALRTLGDRLEEGGVGEVVFVHGTFVGTDPFSVLSTLRALDHRIRPGITDRLGRLLKHASDWLARDHGNFERRYVELFGRATRRPSSTFVWSSENTHAARLLAASRLAGHVAARLDALEDPARRVLLVGHSHAGQVFALLQQMVTDCAHAPELFRLAGVLGEDVDWLRLHVDRLRRLELDVLTLGTPARYGWPVSTRRRVLHLINHRGAEPRAGRLDGVLSTRDGDYIQQWGIAGSDLLATSPSQRRINRELDAILGPGHDPAHWLAQLEHRKRVHDGGHNLLVDYADAANGGVNCLHTNFGHAAYTRRSNMHLWLREAVRRFY